MRQGVVRLGIMEVFEFLLESVGAVFFQVPYWCSGRACWRWVSETAMYVLAVSRLRAPPTPSARSLPFGLTFAARVVVRMDCRASAGRLLWAILLINSASGWRISL